VSPPSGGGGEGKKATERVTLRMRKALKKGFSYFQLRGRERKEGPMGIGLFTVSREKGYEEMVSTNPRSGGKGVKISPAVSEGRGNSARFPLSWVRGRKEKQYYWDTRTWRVRTGKEKGIPSSSQLEKVRVLVIGHRRGERRERKRKEG